MTYTVFFIEGVDVLGFSGFSRETIEFLFTLQINNTMGQLIENKARYKTLLTEPLILLFNDIVPIVLSISPSIETKPSKCISSAYNDMRFEKGPLLKTYMYLRYKEATWREKDVLGLYFDMGCEHYSYGLRVYKQTGAGMDTIRNDILKQKEVYTQAIRKATDSGALIVGDSFAKDRFSDIDNTDLKAFLNRKGFYICYHKNVSDVVFSAKLVDEISAGFYNIKDIYMLLKQALR